MATWMTVIYSRNNGDLSSQQTIKNVLQCDAVCCIVMQCGAVWCSVLQCVIVWCNVLGVLQSVVMCCSVLQSVLVCCSMLHGSRGSILRKNPQKSVVIQAVL